MMVEQINLDPRTISTNLSEPEILPEMMPNPEMMPEFLTELLEDNSDISPIYQFERFLKNFVLAVPNSTIVWDIDELHRIFDKKYF